MSDGYLNDILVLLEQIFSKEIKFAKQEISKMDNIKDDNLIPLLQNNIYIFKENFKIVLN